MMSKIPENLSTCCFETIDETMQHAAKCPKCGYDFSSESQYANALPIGRELNGKYILGKVLGHGGFGITYLAYDYVIGRKVAIKEFFSSYLSSRNKETGNCTLKVNTSENQGLYSTEKGFFFNEAEKLVALPDIPSIVKIYDVFEENNTAYIVMEYVQGETLKEMLSKRPNGKMPFLEVFNLLKPAMEALNTIHTMGILHMDISPRNIMITKSGLPVLIDFSEAKSALIINGHPSHVFDCHPEYAPYVVHNQENVGPWSDIYSMAATLYRAVTGKQPPSPLFREIGMEPYISPKDAGADISVKASDAITKALSLNVKKRPKSMSQFMEMMSNKPSDSKVKQWIISQLKVLLDKITSENENDSKGSFSSVFGILGLAIFCVVYCLETIVSIILRHLGHAFSCVAHCLETIGSIILKHLRHAFIYVVYFLKKIVFLIKIRFCLLRHRVRFLCIVGILIITAILIIKAGIL